MLGDKVGPLVLAGEQKGLDYSKKSVSWIRAKELRFEGCDFSQAHVTNSYFHRAEFVKCKFIGTTFVDCNLRGASFHKCEFKYCTFRNSPVEVGQIERNAPEWENVRRELFQSLRKNFEGLGDVDSARQAFRAEMDASFEHWRSASRGATRYYKDHYSGWQKKVTSHLKLWSLGASRVLWGYGESPLRLLASILAVNVFFALWLAQYKGCTGANPLDQLSMQFSIFLGLGHRPECMPSEWLLIGETFMRFLCMGLVGGVVIRRFVRR